MSIIKSLQTYLEQFKGMELTNNPILTDITDDVSSYALSPAGNSKTVTDIAGNRTYINNYVFYARGYTADETDRQDNHEFLDDLLEWIEDNNEKEIYPIVPSYIVDEISASNALLFDVDVDGRGTYQIQIQLVLRKEKR